MFNLDTNAARAADNKSAFVGEAGKYIGTFTRAEWMEKQETGSTGIGFTFKTNTGAEARGLMMGSTPATPRIIPSKESSPIKILLRIFS